METDETSSSCKYVINKDESRGDGENEINYWMDFWTDFCIEWEKQQP